MMFFDGSAVGEIAPDPRIRSDELAQRPQQFSINVEPRTTDQSYFERTPMGDVVFASNMMKRGS